MEVIVVRYKVHKVEAIIIPFLRDVPTLFHYFVQENNFRFFFVFFFLCVFFFKFCIFVLAHHDSSENGSTLKRIDFPMIANSFPLDWIIFGREV